MRIKKKMLVILMLIIGFMCIIVFVGKDMVASSDQIVQIMFENKTIRDESIDIHAVTQCPDNYKITGMQIDEQPKVENVTELEFTATENRDYIVKVYYQSLSNQIELVETFTTTIDSIKESNNDVSLFTDSRTISENNFTIETDNEKQVASIRGYTGRVKELEIPETIKGYKVIDIGSNAFSGKNLISVKIPDSVTRIGAYAFSGCNLTTITIPNSVTWIGDYAFQGCDLTTVTVPDSVTDMGDNIFSNNVNLRTLNIGKAVELLMEIPRRICSDKSVLAITVNISDSVTKIGPAAFSQLNTNENNLVGKVNIPDSVTSIGGSAFAGCTSLESVEIPDSVRSIGKSAFQRCTSLESLEIPDSVTSIDNYAFDSCVSLKSIEIPDSVRSIGNSAFWGCTSLESIEIPDSVTSLGSYTFSYCEKLSTVKLSKSLSETGEATFKDCTSLEKVVIPEGITTIGISSFEGCQNLKSIKLPKTVTRISPKAFGGCQKLQTVIIDNINNIIALGGYAFQNTALEKFIIPRYVTYNWRQLPISGPSLKFLAVPLNQAIKYNVYKSPQLRDIMIMCTDPNQYNLPDDAKILEIETTNLDVRWYRAVLTGDIYVKQNHIYSAYSKGRKINLHSIFENKGIKEVLYQGKSGTELYTGDSVSIPQDYLELEEGTDISMKYQLIGNPTSSDTKIIDNKLYIGADETSSDLKVTANILSTTKEVPITVVPIDSIAIKNEPQNTYINGEIYNPKGLVITVTYEDGYQEDVIYNDETKNDFLFAYNQLDLTTTKQVITYKGFSIEQNLSIQNRYIDKVLTHDDLKIEVKGKFTENSYIIVEKREDTDSELYKDLDDKNIIGNYEVKVIGKYQGKLFIVFDVGEENNGKKAYIRHLKQDGTIDEYEETVLAGKVGITVSELSPFVIYIDKEKIDINYQDQENNVIPVIKGPLVETKNENQQNTIVTGDRETIIPYITTLGIGTLGIGYYLFKRKQRE